MIGSLIRENRVLIRLFKSVQQAPKSLQRSTMSRFLIGDDLGNIKVLRSASGTKTTITNAFKTESSLQGEARVGVQALTTNGADESAMVCNRALTPVFAAVT